MLHQTLKPESNFELQFSSQWVHVMKCMWWLTEMVLHLQRNSLLHLWLGVRGHTLCKDSYRVLNPPTEGNSELYPSHKLPRLWTFHPDATMETSCDVTPAPAAILEVKNRDSDANHFQNCAQNTDNYCWCYETAQIIPCSCFSTCFSSAGLLWNLNLYHNFALNFFDHLVFGVWSTEAVKCCDKKLQTS